jgi:hypothetical protein
MEKNRKIESLLTDLYGARLPAELVENMLTELRHLADARGLDWERAVRRSAQHWHAERQVSP